MTGLDRHSQRQVGSGDDAHISDAQRLLADNAELAALQKPQQCGLRMGRQRIDFVQKQCPAPRVFDQSRLIALGVGERAAAVSEQGRFDQVVRQRAAIDRHKRAQVARARVVDLARGKFLAGAGVSLDQHR